jgi:Flp pilus assembly CpaF family ATPase
MNAETAFNHTTESISYVLFLRQLAGEYRKNALESIEDIAVAKNLEEISSYILKMQMHSLEFTARMLADKMSTHKVITTPVFDFQDVEKIALENDHIVYPQNRVKVVQATIPVNSESSAENVITLVSEKLVKELIQNNGITFTTTRNEKNTQLTCSIVVVWPLLENKSNTVVNMKSLEPV